MDAGDFTFRFDFFCQRGVKILKVYRQQQINFFTLGKFNQLITFFKQLA